MRKESKQSKGAKSTRTVDGYHCSEHEELRVFTSDRSKSLSEVFASGKLLQGYGVEIETMADIDGGHKWEIIGAVLEKVVFADFPADLFRFEKDGTISGAECISQIMSKSFVRNHYNDFKNLYDVYFPRFGFNCRGGCGMHVNMSNGCFGKDYATPIRKFAYFVNAYYDFCKVLFSRENSTNWCGRMNATKRYWKEVDLTYMPNDHNICFNFGHYNSGRIELRLVGGQKNFATFRNTMECVFHLVDAVKRVSWDDIDDFKKVFKGCNKYVLDRLSRCKNEGVLSVGLYNEIADTADTETELF